MIILGFLGTLLFYAVIAAYFLIMSPIAFALWLITLPFDRQGRVSHYVNAINGRIILFLNPFWNFKTFGIEKIDKKSAYVFAANHQSLIDIPVLASTAFQFKFVAKRELTFIPFIGWLMFFPKYVLLNRKDPKSQFKMMRSCENYLNNNMSIGIFPEGTRSGSEELGRFRDGAALLAKKTDRKIVPICLTNNWQSIPHRFFFWTKRVNMTMHILDPINPSDFEKTKDLSAAVKEAIENKKKELNS